MLFLKYLDRSLAELRNLDLECSFFHFGHDFLKINVFLISEEVEYIIGGDGLSAVLLEPKNKVDPF